MYVSRKLIGVGTGNGGRAMEYPHAAPQGNLLEAYGPVNGSDFRIRGSISKEDIHQCAPGYLNNGRLFQDKINRHNAPFIIEFDQENYADKVPNKTD
jgi:hypothetical protein